MGGWGSGNRTERKNKQRLTNEYRQLDSFDLRKALRLLKQKNIEKHEIKIRWKNHGKMDCIIFIDRLEAAGDTLHFTTVPNNYGGQDKIYFICPKCKRRSRILYLICSRFKCRTCACLVYESQQTTKNEFMAARRVIAFVREWFAVSMPDTEPATLARYTPPRPKGMHRATYEKRIQELAEIQSAYSKKYLERSQRQLDYLTR